MKFKGTIIITDPCYIIKSKDWDGLDTDFSRLGFTNYMVEDTIYGDWSCTAYSTPNKGVIPHLNSVMETAESVYEEEDTTQRMLMEDYLDSLMHDDKSIGEFCADAGMVGIFLRKELDAYNIGWEDLPDWCYTEIEDFDGDIEYYVDNDMNAHIIGEGNVNFYTLQTGC